jgi:hypothetical protein
MQQVWLALIGGLILGWLIEWIVDWQFWRRNLDELRTENHALRRQVADAQAQIAALQPVAPAAVPDTAREEADTHGVTTPPADPQAEGE